MTEHILQQQQDAPGTDTRPVFGYVRVSTKPQEVERQEASLPARHASLPDGLALNRLELFNDSGISGWSGKERPDFAEMFRRIERGEASALIVDTSSRLTRQGIRTALSLFFTLQDARCRFFTTQGSEYASNLGGIISLIVAAEADELYSETISYNTRDGKRLQSSKGYWPHGKVPLGYVAVAVPGTFPKVRKVLEPSPAAPVVQEAFRLYDEDGANQRDVVRYINGALGLTLSRYFARAMLTNETYLGKVKNAGQVFDGLHPALVPQDRFDRIGVLLSKASDENHRPPKKWAFARIARCASCGSSLRYRRLKQRYTYLFCTDAGFPAKTCQQRAIPAGLFEANFAFYLGAIAHGLRCSLNADPSFAVSDAGTDDLGEAMRALDEVREHFQAVADVVADRGMKKDDPRYTSARAERNAAEEAVARISSHARSYREELVLFVESVEQLGQVHPQVQRWIDREHITVSHGDSGDLLGDRFVARTVAGWQAASLETQRQIVERNFTRIEAGPDSLTLHFRTALPGGLALPALFALTDEDRSIVAAENFGDCDTESVSPNGTSRRRSRRARTRCSSSARRP